MNNIVRKFRKEKGIRQKEIVPEIGISRQALINIESYGANPKTTTALKIAKALDTTVENLFDV